MSKKSKLREAAQQPQPPAERLSPFAAPPPAPAPAEDVSRAKFWTFWAGVAAAVIAARALNAALPGVPESVIERWLMLAFGAFLAVFLFKLG